MDITGVAKSHHAGIPKPSSKKERPLASGYVKSMICTVRAGMTPAPMQCLAIRP